MPDYDIAIIGAGPSGAACALALRNCGLKVILVDKEDFPRDKICGDAIPGPVFKVMDQINPEWSAALKRFAPKEIIKSSTGFAPNGQHVTFNWKSFACNSRRQDFDHFLFQLVCNHTDTSIITGKRLVSVEEKPDCINCKLDQNISFNTKLVIGCDGANSVVARQLARQDLSKRLLSTAVRAYYSGVKDVQPCVNEFHFFNEITPGYFWIFPVGENLVNVGLGILDNPKKSNQVNLRETMTDLINSSPSLVERFRGAQMLDKIKGFGLPLSIHSKQISGERFILCGDAAALISPLWGHGIDTGMWSGFYAAQQAIGCFKHKNFSSRYMKQYDSVIYKKITKSFMREAKLLKLIHRFPFLLKLVWGMMKYQNYYNTRRRNS